MSWIRRGRLPPCRRFCRSAALLCRSFYFRPWPSEPVDSSSAAQRLAR